MLDTEKSVYGGEELVKKEVHSRAGTLESGGAFLLPRRQSWGLCMWKGLCRDGEECTGRLGAGQSSKAASLSGTGFSSVSPTPDWKRELLGLIPVIL